jgi:hypothetical protein
MFVLWRERSGQPNFPLPSVYVLERRETILSCLGSIAGSTDDVVFQSIQRVTLRSLQSEKRSKKYVSQRPGTDDDRWPIAAV